MAPRLSAAAVAAASVLAATAGVVSAHMHQGGDGGGGGMMPLGPNTRPPAAGGAAFPPPPPPPPTSPFVGRPSAGGGMLPPNTVPPTMQPMPTRFPSFPTAPWGSVPVPPRGFPAAAPSPAPSRPPTVAGPANLPTVLQDGVPVLDYTAPFTTQFYVYTVDFSQPNASLTIFITPLVGDPNVYAFVGTRNPGSNLPTPPNGYDYVANSVAGVDAIQIFATDAAVTGKAGCVTNPTGCPVWIAVTGTLRSGSSRASNYTLVATDGRTGTQLIADVPSYGVVFSNGTVPAPQYYSFQATAAFLSSSPQVSFTLTPVGAFRGVPTLYIGSSSLAPGCGNNPNPNPGTPGSFFAASSVGPSGRAYYVLKFNDPAFADCFANINQAGTYYIGVIPSQSQTTGNFAFILTASQQKSPVTLLLDGIPSGNDAVYQQLDSYVFNAQFGPGARILRLSTVPLIGSVQIYATVDGSNATDTNYQYASQRWSGENEVVIRFADNAVLNGPCGPLNAANLSCPVSIAIFTATQRSSYQVTARMGAYGRLINGIAQQDYIGAGYATRYIFTITRPNTTATFRLQELSGRTGFLLGSDAVNNTDASDPNDPTTYFYNSLQDPNIFIDSQYHEVKVGDAGFCAAPPCNYYMTVFTFGNWTGGYFTVTASQYGQGVQTLILNVPTTDGIDPDITRTTYNTYVIAYPEAYSGAVPAASLTFALDVVPGSRPTLAASVFLISRSTNFTALTPFNAQYSSRVGLGDSGTTIIVSSSDPAFNASCASLLPATLYNESCGVLVWVVADTVQSIYTITPFAGARQLAEDQIVSSAVQSNSYTYFRYTVETYVQPITIAITPTTGDPDLFIGIGIWPNAVNFTLASRTGGPEVLQITWDSSLIQNAIAQFNLTLPWDLQIAVYGFGGPSNFDIQVASTILNQLTPNLPTVGATQNNSLAYYYFFVPPLTSASQGIRLSWQVITGSQLTVLVNNVGGVNRTFPFFPRCNGACGSGTFSNFVWASFASNQPGVIDIDPSDPSYRAGVNYVIGFYAPVPTTFLVSASSTAGIKQLISGVNVRDTTLPCTYAWYRLDVNVPFEAIRFTATIPGGVNANNYQPTLFTATNTRRPGLNPANQSAFFSQQPPPGPAVITYNASSILAANNGIPCSALPAPGCTVYASILMANKTLTGCNSANAIAYNIKADLINNGSTYSLLSPGVPQTGVVFPGPFPAYYIALVSLPNAQTTVSVTLSPIQGPVDMYITLDGSTPSPTNSAFSGNTSSGVDFILIPPTAPGYAVNMTIRIAVVAGLTPQPPIQPPPPPRPSTFYIWYSTGSEVVQVFAGQSIPGTVLPLSYNYYFFSATTADDITVTVSPSSNFADPNIYVANFANLANNTFYRPGPGNNCGNSTVDGGDFVVIPAAGTPIPPNSAGNYATNCRIGGGTQNFLIAVGCSSRSSCGYFITVQQGDVTPLPLLEGRSTAVRVPPAGINFVAVDLVSTVGAGRNLTLSATSGASFQLGFYATNTYDLGSSDPSALPRPTGGFIWQAPAAGQPLTNQVALTISPDDPAILACSSVTSNCTTLVAAITSNAAATVNVVAYTAGGSAIQLVLGIPFPSGLGAAGTRTFFLDVADITQDLVIFLDYAAGSGIVFTIDPVNTNPTCVPGGAGNPPFVCNGVWSMTTTGTGNQITIPAANPCSTATGPCNNATDGSGSWRPGKYYIGVYAQRVASFSITAAGRLTPVDLSDSFPVSRSITAADPALYNYMPPVVLQAQAPPIRFILTAQGTGGGATVYMRSCYAPQCRDTDRVPSPTNFEYSFAVGANTAAVNTITTSQGANIYCSAPQGAACNYYIAIYPTDPTCAAPQCLLQTTFVAILVDGNTPQAVPSTDIAGTVTNYPVTPVPLGNAQPYEFYLDPSTGPWDLRLTLEACSTRFVTLFGCNPSGPTSCTKGIYTPGKGNADYVASTYGPPASPWTGGRATFTFPAVSTAFAFATLYDNAALPPLGGVWGPSGAFGDEEEEEWDELAEGAPATAGPLVRRRRSLQAIQPTFALTAGAASGSAPAYFIAAGTRNGVPGGITLLPVTNTSDIVVSWPSTWVVDARGNQIVRAQNVQYTVYVAVGGFNATGGAAGGSSCGLTSWASTAAGVPGVTVITTVDIRNVTVTGLLAYDYYEVNVVATCDATCWNTSGIQASQARVLRAVATADELLSRGPARLLFLQTTTQTATYTATNFSSNVGPEQPGNIPSTPETPLGAIIGGAVGGAIALCICILGAVCVRRRRGNLSVPKETIQADDRAKRVAQLGLGGSTPKIEAPTAAASAMAVELQVARAERAAFEPASAGGGAAGGNAVGWK